jgi:protein gp37
MSDLLHDSVPDDFIANVFDAMNARPDLVFQILTKRPERLAKLELNWGEHIWMGASVEDNRVEKRVDMIRQCGAAVKFLSVEPLIGQLDSTFDGIDWVIVGGESGPGFRHMEHAWARTVRDNCLKSGTAYFFKQSSGFRTETGVCLEHEDGTFWVWHQMPGKFIDPVPVPLQMNAKQLAEHFNHSRVQELAWKT